MSVEKKEDFYNEDEQDSESEFQFEKMRGKIELPNKKFSDILCSRRFLEVIGKAGKETKKSGYETDFDISIFEGNNFLIPMIEKGSTAGMLVGGIGSPSPRIIEGEELDEETRDKKHANIYFHFHPLQGVALVPSGSDLSLLENHSLIGVCQAEKNNAIDILLVRAKRNIPPSEVSENGNYYDDELDEYGDTDEMPKTEQNIVSEALDNNGFESFFISFQYKKGKYTLTDKSKKSISKIGDLKLDLNE